MLPGHSSRSFHYFPPQSDTRVHAGSNAEYRAYTDDQGRDWLVLSNLDTEAAGKYRCAYKYPDKQIFTMRFNVAVSCSIL